jgi:penicillin G amidase
MLKKGLLVLLILVIVIAGAVYIFLRTGLPDYHSDVDAPSLSAPVTVERNSYAVPTITADTMEDLFFAWGYVNAQDRLFQMEFTRRVGQGRISEFAGADNLSRDVFLRAVGFEERAKDYVRIMDPDLKQLYQRYVDGINHYLDLHGPNLYMKLLGMEEEQWAISDSIVVGMMLNWSLAYNMQHELLYQRIIDRVGLEQGQKLINYVPDSTPTSVDNLGLNELKDGELAAVMDYYGWLLGCRSASNGWAVGPELTVHGGAILASDMQVHNSKLPNDFYLISLKAGDFEVTGAQITGLPFVVSGYNRHCAWGVTNQGADMVDLFKENIDWEKKTYRFADADYPLAEKEFTFKIKGEEPVVKNVYYVEHKPVLSEVFGDLGIDISLDWTGFDDMDLKGFYLMNAAKNYDEFMEGADYLRISPQNLVFADDQGNIAYRVIGSLPLRVEGTGNLIADGETTMRNWDGNIPDEDYPGVKNPPWHYVITANNKPANDYPYALNGTYSPGYRYENIARLLESNTAIDPELMKKAQTDTFTVLAAKMQGIVKEYVQLNDNDDPNLKKAYALLLGWDGDSTIDSAATSIYNTFYVRFAYNTFADELGDELAAEYIKERYISMERFFDLVEKADDFFNNINTTEKESVADIATLAFVESCLLLEETFGNPDPESWRWGEIHQIRFDHVLGSSALLRPLVNYGPFPFAGDGETNKRARFNEVAPPYIADLASAPRIVVSFEPQPKAYMMLITGQNEYFMSKHNTDMTDAWLANEYFSVDDEPVKYVMKLVP